MRPHKWGGRRTAGQCHSDAQKCSTEGAASTTRATWKGRHGLLTSGARYRAPAQNCWTASHTHMCVCVCAKVQPPQEGQTQPPTKKWTHCKVQLVRGSRWHPPSKTGTQDTTGAGAATAHHSPVLGLLLRCVLRFMHAWRLFTCVKSVLLLLPRDDKLTDPESTQDGAQPAAVSQSVSAVPANNCLWVRA